MEKAVTQLRCERTASVPDYAAGAKSIWMYGHEYVSQPASAQPASRPAAKELDNFSQQGDSAPLSAPVDPPVANVPDDSAAGPAAAVEEPSNFQDFIAASHSLLWMSYRRGFMSLEHTKKESDNGWGCMLRSGQMLMAQTLVKHCIGTDWLKHAPNGANDMLSVLSKEQLDTLKIIAGLFVDHPQCPFSIHNITRLGMKYGVPIGSWFSPTPISLCLRDIVCSVEPSNLTCLVAQNCVVYLDEIRAAFHRPRAEKPNFFCNKLPVLAENADGSRPLQLIVPLRLGLTKIEDVFGEILVSLFHLPQFVGIVGGEPHSSLYFFAGQGQNLYFLNPHVVQSALEPPVPPEAMDLSSYLPTIIRMTQCTKMDPSLALGFYFRSETDFNNFHTEYQKDKDKLGNLFSFEESVTAETAPVDAGTFKDEEDEDDWEVLR